MFCPNCGNKVNDDAIFCNNCGYKFNTTNNNGIEFIKSPLLLGFKNSIVINDDSVILSEQKSLLYIFKTSIKRNSIDKLVIKNIDYENGFVNIIKNIMSLVLIPFIVGISISPVYIFIYNVIFAYYNHGYPFDYDCIDVWNESVLNQGLQIAFWTFISLLIMYILLNLLFDMFFHKCIKILTMNRIYKIKINIFSKRKYNEIKNYISKL